MFPCLSCEQGWSRIDVYVLALSTGAGRAGNTGRGTRHAEYYHCTKGRLLTFPPPPL